jgi:hypothetical protein
MILVKQIEALLNSATQSSGPKSTTPSTASRTSENRRICFYGTKWDGPGKWPPSVMKMCAVKAAEVSCEKQEKAAELRGG